MVRSGFTESVHRGALAVIGPQGNLVRTAGEAGLAMFPRSANKPMQAAAMLESGLNLDGRLLALAAASHAGEPFHISGVGEILAGAGLGEGALQCPPGLPLDEHARAALLRTGDGADRLHMNCSGKHAAMLATCVAAGWPTGTYLSREHPLQTEIRQMVARLSSESVSATGVDGCGAPVFALSLTGLARAFRSLVLAEPGAPERRVADAMRAHPEWTSGTNRPERALMAAVPGLLLKSGAEGVLAFALADGHAGAIKIDDGAFRALPAITVALLRSLGVGAGEGPAPDEAALAQVGEVPVFGGGQVVGHIRPVLP